MISWNCLGKVAEEKLILLKSILSLSNYSANIKIEEVLAEPATPKRRAAFEHKEFFSCEKT
jgi:hypothetical protein